MTRYFDASAAVKLLVKEDETNALVDHLNAEEDFAATSVIGITEVSIAVGRRGYPDLGRTVMELPGWLDTPAVAMHGLAVTLPIARRASEIGGSFGLGTLDAIHVATADAIRGSLTEIVTYDKAMIAACQALGLPAVSPGA